MSNCYICNTKYPISQLKTDDYYNDSYPETLFCEDCYSYNIQCFRCKKRAVACWYNEETGAKGFESDEEDKSIMITSSTLKLFTYKEIGYDTENIIDGQWEKAIRDCFICGELFCAECFSEYPISSSYFMSEDYITLCCRCEERYYETDLSDSSKFVLYRKYKREKRKRKELERKLATELGKNTTKTVLTMFPEDIVENVCSYF